jgi:hypothetical protein
MPYAMMKMAGVPQYDQWTETDPSKEEMRQRASELEHALPGYPYQLSHRGILLPDSLFPHRATVAGRAKKPPHFLGIWMYYGVSQTVRDIIEALEPGVHQLVPIPVYLRSGEPTPMSYSVLNICSLVLQCVDFDRTSDHFVSTMPDGTKRLYPKPSSHSPIYIRGDAVRGLHLWRSRDLSDQMMISDCLMAELEAAKIQGMHYVRCDEI